MPPKMPLLELAECLENYVGIFLRRRRPDKLQPNKSKESGSGTNCTSKESYALRLPTMRSESLSSNPFTKVAFGSTVRHVKPEVMESSNTSKRKVATSSQPVTC